MHLVQQAYRYSISRRTQNRDQSYIECQRYCQRHNRNSFRFETIQIQHHHYCLECALENAGMPIAEYQQLNDH